jgi:hypothetical protein
MVNKLAMAGLAVIFAAGAWLIAAPFVLRYQPAGAAWTGAARLDVGVGAALAAAGFCGFFAALACRVSELYAKAGARPERGARPGPGTEGGVESVTCEL